MRLKWVGIYAGLGVLIMTSAWLAALAARSPIKTKRDLWSGFRIDPRQSFEITYREGWAPHGGGKDFTLSHDGRVTLKRSTDERRPGTRSPLWEQTTFVLPLDAVARALELVEGTGVMGLHASYENTDTFDGTQQFVRISQGTKTKTVSCRNFYPDEFTRFVNGYTALLEQHGRAAKWQPCDDSP